MPSNNRVNMIRNELLENAPTAEDREAIIRSRLFDENWYLTQYPEVASLPLAPLDHYFSIGAGLGRDPGPEFSTRHYLLANPDVVRDGLNPLLHYVKHGRREGRQPLPRSAAAFARDVDIVVPIYNALDDVAKCLAAIVSTTDGYKVRVIVVNDGSGEETTAWLRTFCAANAASTALLEHPVNMGYTRAVNTGLRYSDSAYVITLNSDTIVTQGWLAGLIRCARSSEKIGIVGALSNAATWQNVPELFDYTGAFAINELDEGLSPQKMAKIVADSADRSYPRVNFVNGFCFLIKREVVDAIGIMDEQAFPEGYGEENDYCIRAADAGFELAIADDSYVYHAKSKSFGHARRRLLSKRGSEALARKHTAGRVSSLVAETRTKIPLERIRRRIRARLKLPDSDSVDPLSLRVLFLLPVKGGSGGAHSVVQEVSGLRRLGVQAKVAVRTSLVDSFLAQYSELEDAKECFVGFDEASLPAMADDFDVLVATIFTSVAMVRDICASRPWVLPAYYVQDYEPLFFEPATDHWRAAMASYTALPSGLLFAKTHWICEKVEENHGIKVAKVLPSIDHLVYRPDSRAVGGEGVTRLSAMIRPQTPRRGAARTMRVLERLSRRFGSRVSVDVFGCEKESAHWQNLASEFVFSNHGTLRREEVARVLSSSDIFIDLSDYQAFGRTALEAMACGAVSVVPSHGGADEYAIDGFNSIVVDPFDEDECFKKIAEVIESQGRIDALKLNAMAKASEYSIHRAAVSELAVFAQGVADHRRRNNVSARGVVHVVPAIDANGVITSQSEVRTLLPLKHPGVSKRWKLNVAREGLPEPRRGEVVILAWPCVVALTDQLRSWVKRCADVGTRLVLDVAEPLAGAASCLGDGPRGGDVEVPDWLRAQISCVLLGESADSNAWAWCNSIRRCPVHLSPQLWFPVKAPKKASDESRHARLRIGYLGNPTDRRSIDLVKEALAPIELEYGGKVLIEVIGAFQSGAVDFGQRVGLPKRRDYVGFVDWLHRRVDWDISLLPLTGAERTHRAAFMELAALGGAIVCTQSDALVGLARDGETCLMVSEETSDWSEAIRRLINDPKLRSSIANAALLNAERECVDGRSIIESMSFLEEL